MPRSDAVECPSCRSTVFVQGARANDRAYRCARCEVDFDADSGVSESVPDDVEGLTASRTIVYLTLARAGEPRRPGWVADRTPFARSTVDDALIELHHLGVVERTPDPTDARKSLYSIQE